MKTIPRGFLVGDAKYSIGSLYSDYVQRRKGPQWDAISNYAQFNKWPRYQYLPLTFFIAFTASKGEAYDQLEDLNQLAIKDHLITYILTLAGRSNKKYAFPGRHS